MKIKPNLCRGMIFLCVAGTATTAFGCDRLPAGQALWIRLTRPVSTYTAKAGDPVHAVLTQDLVCDDEVNEVVLPMGAQIEGVVRSRHKVGWGIRHETAALELEFIRATAPSGETTTLSARVEEVENARESVRNGVIQGIRSSNTFQGSINSRLIHLPTWNPYSDPVLMIYKATFPIFPEPEIYYPAGTDLRLRTTKEILSLPVTADAYESPVGAPAESDQLKQLVEQFPVRVSTKKHVDADLLNIAFLGSEDQVKAAFQRAGWHTADPVSRGAWAKNIYALLNNSGYAQQPMMTFLLNDKPEDMNWQKSLNSYGRRDHLRIWRWTTSGADPAVWITSSTHDTGAVLDLKHRGFVHHIAPDIDEERSKVIRDLNFAGCVKSVSYVSRPGMPTATHNSIGDVVITDGSMAVVALQDCHPAQPALATSSTGGSFKPGGHVFRYIRRQILTYRNDIWRANIIYASYDAGRMAFMALRRKPPIVEKTVQGGVPAQMTKPLYAGVVR